MIFIQSLFKQIKFAIICTKIEYKNLFFSSPSCYLWGTLKNVQIFDFQFLTDLHVLGSGESKKHKSSMVSGCSLVC